MSTRLTHAWPFLALHGVALVTAFAGAWTEETHILLLALMIELAAIFSVLLDINSHLRAMSNRGRDGGESHG